MSVRERERLGEKDEPKEREGCMPESHIAATFLSRVYSSSLFLPYTSIHIHRAWLRTYAYLL